MPSKPLEQPRQLSGRMLNLPISDAGARALRGMVAEAIALLSTLA